MSWKQDIIDHVEKRPILFLRFTSEESESIRQSRNGLTKFSFTRTHLNLKGLRIPTVCLFYLDVETEKGLFIGVVKSKRAVATLDSFVQVIDGRPLTIKTPRKLIQLIADARFRGLLAQRIDARTVVLTPKLSSAIVTSLLVDTQNKRAIKKVLDNLRGQQPLRKGARLQANAVRMAMAAFGIGKTEEPLFVEVTEESADALYYLGGECRVVEDNVIAHDARSIPGFKMIRSNITGRAVFEKGNERLEVITANRCDLERMLGVDLVYINSIQNNLVLVQYKMLKREKIKGDRGHDWIFRPDKQFEIERSRMVLLNSKSKKEDYRLNCEPFYLKFVKKFQIGTSTSDGFIIPLEHLNEFLKSPDALGPKGGVRIGYNNLDGRYLREATFLGLIRAGYIGTHSEDTAFLTRIIRAVAKGNKGIVLAWQRSVDDN